MSNTNDVKQLRGPKDENWPVCGLKSGRKWAPSTRKWGDRWPYCSPAWPSVCRRRCGPLVGRGLGGGYMGGGAAPAPPLAAGGASSIRVPKKNARCQGRPPLWRKAEGLDGVAELRPLFPGGPGGETPLLCCGSQALPSAQEENHSCARGQVAGCNRKAAGADT
jgi:hypothetical protein